MMADILNITGLGKLEIVEIYVYYDQPVLFSCKSAAGHLYLGVAAEENDEHETWFYLTNLKDYCNFNQEIKTIKLIANDGHRRSFL